MQLTRQEQAARLVEKFGAEEYARMAFERLDFPFSWGISRSGDIEIHMESLGDYLKAELAKGISASDLIKRDAALQDEAMNTWYNEVYNNQ